jgi:hypothetical protein
LHRYDVLMPKGPRGEKRPADVIGNAVRVMRIATGDEEETAPSGKNLHAVELGRLGGKKGVARAKAISKKQRKASASKAANARWNNMP